MAPILCSCLMTPWRLRRRPGTGRRPRTCSSSYSSTDTLWQGTQEVLNIDMKTFWLFLFRSNTLACVIDSDRNMMYYAYCKERKVNHGQDCWWITGMTQLYLCFSVSLFHVYSLFSPPSGDWRTWNRTFPPSRSVLPTASSRNSLNGWTSPRSSSPILVIQHQYLNCVTLTPSCTFWLGTDFASFLFVL